MPAAQVVTRVLQLSAIGVDKDIIFRDGSKHRHAASPYSYAIKVVEFNRSRLREQYALKTVYVDHEKSEIHIHGENGNTVSQAAQAVTAMLQKPVLSYSVDPELVVALRLFKDLKKDFSTQTGCWLHFIWMSRTVTCYGLDGNAAYSYLHSITRRLQSGEPSSRKILFERTFDRQAKEIIKRLVDDIESNSGANLALKTDSGSYGVCVQFYGAEESISEAIRIIEYHIRGERAPSTSSTASSVGTVSYSDGEDNVSRQSETPVTPSVSFEFVSQETVPEETPEFSYVYSNSPYAFKCCGCGLWASGYDCAGCVGSPRELNEMSFPATPLYQFTPTGSDLMVKAKAKTTNRRAKASRCTTH